MLKFVFLVVLLNTINAGRYVYPYGSKYAPVYYSLRNPDKSFDPMPSINQVTIATSPPNNKCVSPKNVCKRDYQCPSHQKCFEDLFCGYKVCKNIENTSSISTTTTVTTTKSPIINELTTEPPCADACVQCVVSRYRCELDSQCPPCYTCCQDIYYVYKVCKHVSNVTTTSAVTTISTTLTTSEVTTAVTTTTSETTTTITTTEGTTSGTTTGESTTVSETIPTTTTTKATTTTKFTVRPEPDIDGSGSGSGSGDGSRDDDETGWDVRPLTGSTRKPETEFSFNEIEEIVTDATTSSEVEIIVQTFEPTTTFNTTTLKPTTVESHKPDEEFSGDEERNGDDEDTDAVTIVDAVISQTASTTTQLPEITTKQILRNTTPRVTDSNRQRKTIDESIKTQLPKSATEKTFRPDEVTEDLTLELETLKPLVPDDEYEIETTPPSQTSAGGGDEEPTTPNVETINGNERNKPNIEKDRTLTDQEGSAEHSGNDDEDGFSSGDEESTTPNVETNNGNERNKPNIEKDRTLTDQEGSAEYSGNDDEDGFSSGDEESATPNVETNNNNERNRPNIEKDRTLTDQEGSAEHGSNDVEDGFSSGDEESTTPNVETNNGNERNKPNIEKDRTLTDQEGSAEYSGNDDEDGFSSGDDNEEYSGNDKVPHPPRKNNSPRHEEMDKNEREGSPLINDLEVLPDIKPDSYLSNKDYYVIVDDYE